MQGANARVQEGGGGRAAVRPAIDREQGSADQLGQAEARQLGLGLEPRVLEVAEGDLGSMAHDVRLHHIACPDGGGVTYWLASVLPERMKAKARAGSLVHGVFAGSDSRVGVQ